MSRRRRRAYYDLDTPDNLLRNVARIIKEVATHRVVNNLNQKLEGENIETKTKLAIRKSIAECFGEKVIEYLDNYEAANQVASNKICFHVSFRGDGSFDLYEIEDKPSFYLSEVSRGAFQFGLDLAYVSITTEGTFLFNPKVVWETIEGTVSFKQILIKNLKEQLETFMSNTLVYSISKEECLALRALEELEINLKKYICNEKLTYRLLLKEYPFMSVGIRGDMSVPKRFPKGDLGINKLTEDEVELIKSQLAFHNLLVKGQQ